MGVLDTSDYSPFGDNGYIRIFDENGLVATPFAASVGSVGDFGQTPWTQWSFVTQTDGFYTIEAGVANTGDSGVDSWLGVDAVQVTRGATTDGNSHAEHERP